MATAITRIFCFVFTMMSFTAVLSGCCSARIYKVGDTDGWSMKDYIYYAWAEDKKFHVGDSLIFEYDRNMNDVTQVSGALEYQFCNSSSPKAVYNTGHNVVTLMEPGYHYFITSNHARCVYGQKLGVLVVRYTSRPIPPPPPPPPSTTIPLGNTYKVGDSKEWRVHEERDFYYKWSEEKQFHVGDGLIFYYDDEANDVVEISSGLKFKSCDPTSPIAVHNTGQDLIWLTKPGIHYFISSKFGHCEAGLKLRVVVRPLARPVPKKLKLSPLGRLIKWLQAFRPQPHH